MKNSIFDCSGNFFANELAKRCRYNKIKLKEHRENLELKMMDNLLTEKEKIEYLLEELGE